MAIRDDVKRYSTTRAKTPFQRPLSNILKLSVPLMFASFSFLHERLPETLGHVFLAARCKYAFLLLWQSCTPLL